MIKIIFRNRPKWRKLKDAKDVFNNIGSTCSYWKFDGNSKEERCGTIVGVMKYRGIEAGECCLIAVEDVGTHWYDIEQIRVLSSKY